MSRRRGLSDSGTRDLAAYRAKRDPERTPEPFGAGSAGAGLFVVQQHAARRLHYDFRLAWRGVLLSWAVPKGPSLDPAQRRLAVRVEDHPLEYADFEGIIPEGNYGAGAVIVWDRGRWIPLEDPDAGLERGKLLFELEGYKLRGRFTLVRSGGRERDGRDWLLIKKHDAQAMSDSAALPPESVLSGLRVEELREGSERLRALERRIAELAPPRRRLVAAEVRPMLAETARAPFSGREWLFEVKYDGYRMIGAKEDGCGLLYTRNGRPAAERFPEIARALAALPVERVVLDGELVATDRTGRPVFQRLQQRALLERRHDVARAAVESPATYFVFDLLGYGDFDLRELPLARRKELLAPLVPPRGPLRLAPHFAERGEAVFEEAIRHGFEGVVAKRSDAPYRAGRSPLWKKLRRVASGDFVIAGFSEPRGGRVGLGALHLAGYEEGELVYRGRVGSGFSDADLVALREVLEPLRRKDSPCRGPLPRTRGNVWVEPQYVCEVRYAEVTADGLLRQPVFVRMRDDKAPEECGRERPAPAALPARRAEPPAPAARTETRDVPFTHLDKVFWPDEGITKGDLVAYYRAIAPWLLPYLRDRPLLLTRYPDGIAGKSFFQKDAPEWVPAWVRTERMWSEQAQREVSVFVCDDVDSLLYVVNLGTIPLHVRAARVTDLQHPDWCILDLDPKGAPFAHVVALAREIRDLCAEAELPAYPKTSGGSGLHVLIPLGGRLSHAQSRMLAELLARQVAARRPEIATLTRRVGARGGKVYIDTLQNGHGRVLVAPFSVRARPGAPVSMPLRWREVGARLDPARYTLRNAPARLRRLREDPLVPVLSEAPDLEAALERFAARLRGSPAPLG